MQLSSFPFVAGTEARFHHSGDTDDFLWSILDEIGAYVLAGTDGSNLAPELLDPFVFAQFVAGIEGKYTVNGTPFHRNWRLLPAARRMAERLGIVPLAQALAETEAELPVWGAEILDLYDNSPDSGSESLIGAATSERLFQRLDKRFWPLVESAVCTYGTQGGGIWKSLSEWIMNEMPRTAFPDEHSVSAQFSATHDWARDAVAGYNRSWTTFRVGDDVYEMLEQLGLRLRRQLKSPAAPATLPVVPCLLEMTDGSRVLRLDFSDAVMLADPDEMAELARKTTAPVSQRRDDLPKRYSIAEEPKIAFDEDSCTTRIPPRLALRANVLRYASDAN